MPVFTVGVDPIPAWCQVRHVEIAELAAGEERPLRRLGPRERLIVARGACAVRFDDATGATDAREGATFSLDAPASVVTATGGEDGATLVRFCGAWGEPAGGFGLFSVAPRPGTADRGDPVPYSKDTGFDSHFHDCDEYWVVLEGTGVAVSEGHRYDVGPGACVVTGMGHHHDFPSVSAPVRAVYFESTLEGARRRGHLWQHTHGPAAPRPERV